MLDTNKPLEGLVFWMQGFFLKGISKNSQKSPLGGVLKYVAMWSDFANF
jgi:hypothetical protein